MAERNAVKSRLCLGCETEFRCTAKELAQRFAACRGGAGSVFLPDCGLRMNENLIRVYGENHR